MDSEKNADILLNIIDQRCKKVLKKSNIVSKMAGRVVEVSPDNTKASVKFADDNNVFGLLNKTGEKLSVGDNVFVESIKDDLTNGFISEKFGTYTFSNVINNLTSSSTTDSLSAAMGKELNEKFNIKHYGTRNKYYLFATKPINPTSTNAGLLTLFISNLDFYDKGIAGFINIDRDGTMYVSTILPTSKKLSSFQKSFHVYRDNDYFYFLIQSPNYNDGWNIEVLSRTGLFNLKWTTYNDSEFNTFKADKTLVSSKQASIQGTIQGTFPALLNSWVAYTTGANTISRTNDIVTLTLSLKSGTAKMVCQLPVGFRPKASSYYAITNLTSHTASVFYITTDGYVQLENAEVGKSIFANVSFIGS